MSRKNTSNNTNTIVDLISEDIYRFYVRSYPREVMWGGLGLYAVHRIKVYNLREFVEFLKKYKCQDLHIGVQPYLGDDEKTDFVVESIIIEFDVDHELPIATKEGLKKCLEVVKRVYEYFKRFGYEPLVLFSGAHGFYIIIDVPQLRLNHPREVMRTFIEKVLEKCGYSVERLKDYGIDVDFNRLSFRALVRIPYTLNPKSNLYCIPINDMIENNLGVDLILERAKKPVPKPIRKSTCSWIAPILIQLDKELDKISQSIPKGEALMSEVKPEGGFMNLPCIRALFENPLPPGARWKEACKIIAIAYWLDKGTTEGYDVIAKLFAERQKLGHPLHPAEVRGWIRWAKKMWEERGWLVFNCAEVRKWFKEWKLKIPCYEGCPYLRALREYEKKQLLGRVKELLSSNLLDEIVRVTNNWMVGEENNRKLLYLLILLNQSIIVKGETSSGKNTLVESVLKLFPEDWVCTVTAGSPKFLRWIAKDYIPILYIKELPSEMARRGYVKGDTWEFDLKQAMSDHEIQVAYAVPRKGKSPITRFKTIKVGAIITTTTEYRLPEDLENRCWIIATNPSPELTEKVKVFHARKRAELFPERVDLTVFREASKLIMSSTRVVNPCAEVFVEILKGGETRERRDVIKILSLAEAIAKTKLPKRKFKVKNTNEEVVLVYPEDIIEAYELIRRDLETLLSHVDPRIRRAYQVFREIEEREGVVTVRKFATEMRISITKARKMIHDMLALGLIDELEERGAYGAKQYVSRSVEEKKFGELDVKRLYNTFYEWLSKYGEFLEKTEE